MSKQPNESIKFSHLNIELRAANQRLPIHWLNFKNYYNKNGKNPNKVIWNKPLLNIEGMQFEDIVQYYVNQDADVYSFSSYLWSHLAIMAIAEEVKKRMPNALVVLGGPHLNITHNNLDWFFKHKFVDALCEPTSYGEWFVTDMLDQLTENGSVKWKDVSFAIFKTGRGPTPNKRDFKFPSGIIAGNEDIVFECKEISLERNIPLVLPIEMSRGCPYECVFCEWGGGIGGKVVRKNMEYILEDLNAIPQFGIEQIQILDANYGIFKDDVDVSKHIEDLKNTFDLPKHVEIYGMTKSKDEARWKTIEPLARAKVVERYKLSLQSLSDKVLRNIKRTDIPRERDFEFAQYLFDQYGVRSDFEFIMGLPGSTLDNFYEEVDIQYEYGYNLERYIWMFLPDSPAYDDAYKKQFNIKTVKTCVGKTKMNSYAFDDVKNFSEYNITADPKYLSDVEFVIQADGYTKEDYTEIFFMNFWIIQGYCTGSGKDISDADSPQSNSLMIDMHQGLEYNIKQGKLKNPSEFYRKVYQYIMNPGDNKYALAMKDLRDQIYELVNGQRKEIVDFREYNLPHTDVSVELSYIFRSCAYVFHEDYVKFILRITNELGMKVPDEFVERFKNNIHNTRQSQSPKYDRAHQILVYYENFIRNLHG